MKPDDNMALSHKVEFLRNLGGLICDAQMIRLVLAGDEHPARPEVLKPMQDRLRQILKDAVPEIKDDVTFRQARLMILAICREAIAQLEAA